jgi:predicted branched-subunit amino acid permease
LRRREFLEGIKAGIPVCLGYFSVSFGFGAMALAQGLKLWEAVLISASNLTSAGQFAGLTVITAGATVLELILTQLVINSRYALMGLALSQRLGPTVGTLPRLAMAFFDTDEVFALGMSRPGKLTGRFFLGAGLIAALGWTLGTACGALAGSLLPMSVRLSLGALLYGMFIAIVAPQARQEKPMLACMGMALVLSCLFAWVPGLNTISSGIAIVICTVGAAALCALLFPVKEDDQ